MILCQFLHQEPVAVSYLLGCVGKGAGAVIDPVFNRSLPANGGGIGHADPPCHRHAFARRSPLGWPGAR